MVGIAAVYTLALMSVFAYRSGAGKGRSTIAIVTASLGTALVFLAWVGPTGDPKWFLSVVALIPTVAAFLVMRAARKAGSKQ
jgi:predicted small integral membrane protein